MYTPRQSIAVSTKSCPYDGIPFRSALRPMTVERTFQTFAVGAYLLVAFTVQDIRRP